MKRWTILQRRAGTDWPLGKKIGLWAWNLGLYLLSLLGLGALSLLLSVGSYDLALTEGFWETPVILVLNLLPVIALGLLCYAAIGRAQWSFLVTALVVVGGSVGNYWKIAFRDDPVVFGDLLVLREAGAMAATRYELYWDKTMILTVACVVLGFVALWLLARGRARWRLRLSLLLVAIAVGAGVTPAILSDKLYEGDAANYEYLEVEWATTQQYAAHGFIYPFLHSIKSAIDLPPADYDEAAAKALLAEYENEDIPEGQKVNILGVMLESFNDFSKFGTPELSQDVYAIWHRLEDEGVSGNLVTNIFGGGTIDSERTFLTGYSSLREFRSNVNAYPWYFRTQGYRVDGMHPYSDWFYNRSNVNRYLGFQEYYMMDNYFSAVTDEERALDNLFFQELMKVYDEAAASDTPYFHFSVSFQGHGPYSDYICWWGKKGEFVKEDDRFTEQQQYILDNYFGSVMNTQYNLGLLTDHLRDDPEPVVVILYGDHNPALGSGSEIYNLLGIDLDQGSQTGFYNYYSTRYIIWANEAAKAVLGNDFTGEGPDLSPCFLMNEVFRLCGWKGPAYMQAVEPVALRVPVVHTSGRYLVDGQLTNDLPAQEAALVKGYQDLQYYWRKHFAYGDYVAALPQVNSEE